MALDDIIFREHVVRVLSAVVIARDGLTSDERTILAAIAAGFGISLAEVLPPAQRTVMVLPAERARSLQR